MYKWGPVQELTIAPSSGDAVVIKSPDPKAVVLMGSGGNVTIEYSYVADSTSRHTANIARPAQSGAQGQGNILSLGSDMYLRNSANAQANIFYNIGVPSKV